MVVEDVDHGSHGLLPHDTVAGRFTVGLAVGGLFVANLALVGGVHAPHKMVLAPMEGISLSSKPGVFILREGFGKWPSHRGWDLLQRNVFSLP